MRGVRWEPAEVWLNDGRPARFGWRGRIYTVLAILERPPGEARLAEDQSVPLAPGDPERTDPAFASWRCWRVSASPGKKVPAQAYWLCHNPAGSRWLLSRDAG